MSVLFDIIGATLLAGMLMVIVMSINTSLVIETSETSAALNIQNEGLQVARILEFDMYKMGYRAPQAPATHKISIADTSEIQFQSAIYDSSMLDTGNVYTIHYLFTPPAIPGPHHYGTLTRSLNGLPVAIDKNVVRFYLSYYDSVDNQFTPTPVTGAKLDSIRSVKIQLRFEAIVAVDTTTKRFQRTGDSTYTGTYFQKWIYPRSLHK